MFCQCKSGGEAKQEREGDCRGGICERIDRRFDGRDVKDRAAPVDEEFGVVVGGETLLNLAALTPVRFEAEEGAEREGGER